MRDLKRNVPVNASRDHSRDATPRTRQLAKRNDKLKGLPENLKLMRNDLRNKYKEYKEGSSNGVVKVPREAKEGKETEAKPSRDRELTELAKSIESLDDKNLEPLIINTSSREASRKNSSNSNHADSNKRLRKASTNKEEKDRVFFELLRKHSLDYLANHELLKVSLTSRKFLDDCFKTIKTRINRKLIENETRIKLLRDVIS